MRKNCREILTYKYQRPMANKEAYDHKDYFHLPKVVMDKIKPIFRDLASPDLKDEIRIRQAENAIEELEKKCRQRTKLTKLRLEELLEEEEDPNNPAYAPGHY
ncbi:hypothetical protein J6590_106824 [Homalodisca vitripennis]|nr:hypothetical protein J6590_106824 [Homalodisca vitripennis]